MLKTVVSTIPMFVCAFWSIVLLLEYKSKNKAKVFLGFYMFVAFLLYIGHTAYFNQEYTFYKFWDNIYIFCSLAVYPLYFIYIKLISKKMSLELKDFWVLIPSVLMFIFSLTIYFSMSDNEQEVFSKNLLYNKNPSYYSSLSTPLKLELIKHKLFTVIYIIQLIPIVFFGRKYILEYNRKIRDYYSDTEGKTLQQFNYLLYIFIITSIASIIVSILGKSFFINSSVLLLIPAFLFGLLLFFIGYLGFKQEFTLESFIMDVNNDESNINQPNDNETNNDYNDNVKLKLLNELNKLLEDEEIYKKTDLRIIDISKRLNTNRTYISKIVNEELKINFCDLINKYRVEHAKKLLNDKNNQSVGLTQIGELSGFKSNSSFYRIFKEKEGISPGDFRRNIK